MRFVKEYANYKKRCLNQNDLMNEEYKAAAITEIEKVVREYGRGLLTADEAVRAIADCPRFYRF